MEFRVQQQRHSAVCEESAVAGVEVGFGRQPLRQNERMTVEFHVVVGDRFRVQVLHDGHVVDQQVSRDQLAVNVDGMGGGHQQVAPRQVVAESAGADTDRGHGVWLPVVGDVDLADAHPLDRHRDGHTVLQGDDHVACF